ncbi:glycosyltransferase family 2 protein [Lacisediminihabitans sp.]|uniref:glycosyltransferase family 2 protein n=1 Tax=Lacisediminihabitans sp. TaxID=2787631 RepID=UPI00374D5796
MTDRVSVALCSHNGAPFIEAQLLSIVNQTVAPAEIVLSDDASVDDTVAIARKVLLAHPNVALTVLQNPVALGVTANFERAIRACTGEFIALCDQDDVWHPDRLATVLREFDSRADLDLVFTDARLVDSHGTSLDRTLFDVLELSAADRGAVHAGEGFAVFIRRNVATGATMMLRRRLLDAALPFASGWVHDEWLAAIATVVGRVDLVDEQLIDYRQHASNQIGVAYPTLRRKLRRVLEPRGDRNARLSLQFAQFAERLDSLGATVPERMRRLARAKAAFEAEREALPASRVRRVAPILAAHRRGWYSRFASQGRLDMVRDLLQSH